MSAPYIMYCTLHTAVTLYTARQVTSAGCFHMVSRRSSVGVNPGSLEVFCGSTTQFPLGGRLITLSPHPPLTTSTSHHNHIHLSPLHITFHKTGSKKFSVKMVDLYLNKVVKHEMYIKLVPPPLSSGIFKSFRLKQCSDV